MRRSLATVLLLLAATVVQGGIYPTGGPTTTDNDDSCDIALLPAATLLLPYFEVDLTNPNGETTLFTVTNVGAEERIAHVTLWSDHSWPVLDFNLRLTGYDVQSINLADVLTAGHLVQNCDAEPVTISPAILARVREALVRGAAPPDGAAAPCGEVASNRGRAAGFVTIDVVGECTSLRPSETAYYDTVRFDNVLVGDYQQVHRALDGAQGGPLVHIRAVPESGGTVNLPQTFYGRYQSAASPKRDRRQPLPSTFAVRWIDDQVMDTSLKVWRNTVGTAQPPCERNVCEPRIPDLELITFDEQENAAGESPREGPANCYVIGLDFPTDSAFRSDVDDGFFPEIPDASAGWMYLNLSDDQTRRQAWVISTMHAEGRYSVDVDALALGNGCSPVAPATEIDPAGTAVLGPAPNVTP